MLHSTPWSWPVSSHTFLLSEKWFWILQWWKFEADTWHIYSSSGQVCPSSFRGILNTARVKFISKLKMIISFCLVGQNQDTLKFRFLLFLNIPWAKGITTIVTGVFIWSLPPSQLFFFPGNYWDSCEKNQHFTIIFANFKLGLLLGVREIWSQYWIQQRQVCKFIYKNTISSRDSG